MNKLLLPAILTHRAIDEVKLNRQKCRPVASNATSSLHAHAGVAAPRSLDNGTLTKAAMTHSLHESRAATISSSSGSKAVKKRTRTTLEDEERSSSRIIVGESPCDTLLSCYNNWMDFVEIASELVAAEVSEDSVCDSFLRIKSGSSRGQHATALALTTTSDSTVSCLAVSNALSDKCIHMSDGINDSASVNSSSTREPSYSALQSPGKELSGGTSNLAADNRKQETARTETSSSRKQKRDVVSQYNDAASAFVCGILSIDEATLCDEYLLAQSTSKESAIQELLQDLYPIPQGRGYGVHSDTAPEEVSIKHRLGNMRVLFLFYNLHPSSI